MLQEKLCYCVCADCWFCNEKHISLRRVNNVKIPTHRLWSLDRVVAIIPRIWPFKAHWLLYVPVGLTFDNSTFCPHSAFMCFVWIWEQTAIISLYSINWLVFITEMECVYSAVRTGYLYIILRSAHIVHLCVLYRSQNKQRLFPYTTLTDWFLELRRSVFTARYGLSIYV